MSKRALIFCLIGLFCFAAAGCHDDHHDNNRGSDDRGKPGSDVQTDCGDITYVGVCSKDLKSVTYCDDNGELQKNDCSNGATCQMTDENYYDCVKEESSEKIPCGDVTYKGVCGKDGKSFSYCDENNSLRTYTCEEGKTCQLITDKDNKEVYDCVEGKPQEPEQQAGCGKYTNVGECSSDQKSVTYCSNDGKELKTDKCGDNEVCQELEYNGYKYNGCSISSAEAQLADPTEFGDLKKECGALGEGGLCSSDKKAYQFCNRNTKTIWAVECKDGTSCQWVDDGTYHYLDCVEDKSEQTQTDESCGSDFKESCANNVITYCNENKIATKKCDSGTTCKMNNNNKFECVSASSERPSGDKPARPN